MAAAPEDQQYELHQQIEAHMHAEQLHREQRIAQIMQEQNRVADIIHQEAQLRQQQQQAQLDHEQRMAEQMHQMAQTQALAHENELRAQQLHDQRLQQMHMEQQIQQNYEAQLKAANELNEQRLADMHRMNQEQQQLDALNAQRQHEAMLRQHEATLQHQQAAHPNGAGGAEVQAYAGAGLPNGGRLAPSAPIVTHTALGPIPDDLAHLDPHIAESIMRSRQANMDFDATLKRDQLAAHQVMAQPIADALRQREQQEIEIARQGSPAVIANGVHNDANPATGAAGAAPHIAQVVHPSQMTAMQQKIHDEIHRRQAAADPTRGQAISSGASTNVEFKPGTDPLHALHVAQVVHPNQAMQQRIHDEIHNREAAADPTRGQAISSGASTNVAFKPGTDPAHALQVAHPAGGQHVVAAGGGGGGQVHSEVFGQPPSRGAPVPGTAAAVTVTATAPAVPLVTTTPAVAAAPASNIEALPLTPVKGYNPYNFFLIGGERGAVSAAPPGAYEKFGTLPQANHESLGATVNNDVHNMGHNMKANFHTMLHNVRGIIHDTPNMNFHATSAMQLKSIKDNPLAKYQQAPKEQRPMTQKELDKLWGHKYELEQRRWGSASMTDADRKDRIEKVNEQLGLQQGHRTTTYIH